MENDRNTEQMVLTLFEQGRKFTEELIAENEKLRKRAGLTDGRDKGSGLKKLREELESLRKENNELRTENQQLKDQFIYVEDENREFAERYIEVEKQNSDLINLYVSSHRLHSTLDYDNIVQIMKEIVINMVGSEQFGIFMFDAELKDLRLISHESLSDELRAAGPTDERITTAAKSGQLYCKQDGISDEKNNHPIACIPLCADGRVFGVIAIYSLLIQKTGFEQVDLQLFELLGNHAATAIYSARLNAMSPRASTLSIR